MPDNDSMRSGSITTGTAHGIVVVDTGDDKRELQIAPLPSATSIWNMVGAPVRVEDNAMAGHDQTGGQRYVYDNPELNLYTPDLRCPRCRCPVRGLAEARELYADAPHLFDGRTLPAIHLYSALPCGCDVSHHWAGNFAAEIAHRRRSPRDHRRTNVVVLPSQAYNNEREQLRQRYDRLRSLRPIPGDVNYFDFEKLVIRTTDELWRLAQHEPRGILGIQPLSSLFGSMPRVVLSDAAVGWGHSNHYYVPQSLVAPLAYREPGEAVSPDDYPASYPMPATFRAQYQNEPIPAGITRANARDVVDAAGLAAELSARVEARLANLRSSGNLQHYGADTHIAAQLVDYADAHRDMTTAILNSMGVPPAVFSGQVPEPTIPPNVNPAPAELRRRQRRVRQIDISKLDS